MRFLKLYNKTIILTLVILFLSLYNVNKIIPHSFYFFKNEDKVIHLLMYFAITIVLLFESYLANPKSIYKIYRLNLIPFALGGAIELFQEYLTQYRSGDWIDFFADVAGIILADILFKYIKDYSFFKKAVKFPFQ